MAMTTETIQRRWRAGAELSRKLNRYLKNKERATRPALEVERVLAICRTCGQFRGNDCAELALRAGSDGEAIAFHELLCTADRFCRRWPLGLRPTSAPTSAPDPVVADVEAADRVHAAGVKRSQAERRAARRRRYGKTG